MKTASNGLGFLEAFRIPPGRLGACGVSCANLGCPWDQVTNFTSIPSSLSLETASSASSGVPSTLEL